MTAKRKNSRTLIFTGILLFSIQIGLSQAYQKIPIDTNYYWRQFSVCLDSANQVKRLDYQIRYFNDTIINGTTYNKYAPFGRSFGQPVCTSYIQYGYLRQDTLSRRVFMLDRDFIERPLYDFSKNVGDTLLSYNHVLKANETLTIMSVATATLFNGSQRKALWTSNQNCFIEGAGAIFGGLYGHTQLFVHGVSEQLMCFGTIAPFFELLEGISTQQYVCAFVPATVGVFEDYLLRSSVSVHPNPTNGIVTVSTYLSDRKQIILLDATGREIMKAQKSDERFELDMSAYASGIYFLLVTTEVGLITRKIVKQ